MKKITQAERQAICETIAFGKEFGFGNLISHLQTAWARELIEHYGVDENSAHKHTIRDDSGYPFAMQDDLCERGEWDETGERYRHQIGSRRRPTD